MNSSLLRNKPKDVGTSDFAFLGVRVVSTTPQKTIVLLEN